MLLLFVSFMLLSSFVFLLISRDRRAVLIFLTEFFLFIFIYSILMYISKKGGISSNMSIILFGFRSVRLYFQYISITLGQLGYFIAIGRYIFPLFLLLTALDMAYFDCAIWMKKHFYIFLVFPCVSLFIYYPAIFHNFLSNELLLRAIVSITSIWVYGYIALSAIVILIEFFSITMSFFRRRFLTKSFILISVGILFSLYAGQDPAQVYLFYKNDYMWMLGLVYLSAALNPFMYGFVMIASVLSSIIGFFYLLKYIRVRFDEKLEEVTFKRSSKAATTGISMFTHGTKNELLASRILLEKASLRYPEDVEIEKALKINTNLLNRLNSLNHMAHAENTRLVPTPLLPIVTHATEQLFSCYGQALCSIELERSDIEVLADAHYLEDALANLLINAWEANVSNHEAKAISMAVTIERLWISIAISDDGKGISKEVSKHIWEPFYSSKSSSTNWGMGMYFTRNVIKGHLGTLRFESRDSGGTTFIVLLPRLGKEQVKGEL